MHCVQFYKSGLNDGEKLDSECPWILCVLK